LTATYFAPSSHRQADGETDHERDLQEVEDREHVAAVACWPALIPRLVTGTARRAGAIDSRKPGKAVQDCQECQRAGMVTLVGMSIQGRCDGEPT